MAELLSGILRKFNTIEFVLLEGGDERFKRGKSGVIQDFWVKGGDLFHPEVKFSIWTKSRSRSKAITCYWTTNFKLSFGQLFLNYLRL